jgi:DNA-binding NarL/FixJ family response regulator
MKQVKDGCMTELIGIPTRREGQLQDAMVRVLIVEDYEPMRQQIVSMLTGVPELRVVAEVGNGIDAVQVAGELQPDLPLMDIGLPMLDGIQATRRIRKASPGSRILFVTENRSLDIVEEALRSGGSGYVLKSHSGKELLPAIDAVLGGERFISVGLAALALDANTANPGLRRFLTQSDPQSTLLPGVD